MYLKSLTLENFRCYERARVELPAGLVVALGPNASGKTTLLEAVYLLATTTTPRSGRARAMIRHGESRGRVTGVFVRQGRELSVRITLGDPSGERSGAKTVEVDGREVASSREAIGRVQAVLFWVGSLEVVKGSPSNRRRFMNTAIGQMSARYLDDLARYRRALRQRNELLKRIAARGGDGRTLAPWTHALVEAGAPIVEDRGDFVRSLAAEAGPLHGRLGAGAEELAVRYDPSVPAPLEGAVADEFYRRLEETHRRELERGSTQVGPHRDEVVLEVDGVDVRRFGSQGQQRTAALALTLAQAQVAVARTEIEPILLLDDCLSELDAERGTAMLDLSADREQMIVTSACCPEHLAARLADAHVIDAGDPASVEAPEA
ncbi:MAG: DNA replication/repair protein RecF [Armatimonadota bacterium]|nr:DNA replication/repair protein RecF [Armatimonadota bacterium]